MKLLKFVYKGLITGMPILTYNPFNKNHFHAPFTIHPKSLYVNFKLNNEQKNIIQNDINLYSPDLKIIPIQFNKDLPEDYYLSINIYNCTSPLFFNENPMTRLEINTYVNDGIRNSTVILDYVSSYLSMDPINIFKSGSNIFYNNNLIHYNSKNVIFDLNLTTSDDDSIFNLSSNLVKMSDYIYYKNGILDKLFYDSSLVYAIHLIPQINKLHFSYNNLNFSKVDSIFYFNKHIYCVGSMWDNLNF